MYWQECRCISIYVYVNMYKHRLLWNASMFVLSLLTECVFIFFKICYYFLFWAKDLLLSACVEISALIWIIGLKDCAFCSIKPIIFSYFLLIFRKQWSKTCNYFAILVQTYTAVQTKRKARLKQNSQSPSSLKYLLVASNSSSVKVV